MLYSLCKELAPSTAIQHALQGNFTSPTDIDLLVSKGNILEIYRVRSRSSSVDYNLSLHQKFTLQGVVTSMAFVRIGSTDSLLLTFKDAKMSLVEYSNKLQNLVTVSLHHYEKEDLRKDIQHKGAPVVKVDHLGRCAMMKFYNNQFAILPFKSDSVMRGEEEDLQKQFPFLPSYVVTESEIDQSIRHVIDFEFLYGYLEPTIAILYEPDQTFVGRLAHKKDTMCVVVISLNIFQKGYTILYRVNGLPHNCTHIQAVPNPIGGIMIYSHNAIIHLNQTHIPGLAAIVNPFFDMESHFKAPPVEEGPIIPVKNKPPSVYVRDNHFSDFKALGISLDGSHATFINPDTILLILRSGKMFEVELIGDEGTGRSWKRKRGGVKRINVKSLGLSITSPAGIVNFSKLNNFTQQQQLGLQTTMDSIRYFSNYIFIYSTVFNAILLQYSEPLELKYEVIQADGAEIMEEDELDDELYGGTGSKMKSSIKKKGVQLPIKYRVMDTILVTGPIRDISVGKPATYSSHKFEGELSEADLEITACAGYGAHGSLIVFNESIRPRIISSFDLAGVEDMWSVKVRPSNEKSHNSENDFHKFLVLSRENGTSVLATGEEFLELEQNEYYTAGPTVMVGTILNESLIIQIHPDGIVLLKSSGMRISETLIGSEERWIVSCSISDPYVGLLMNTDELIVFEVKDTFEISMVKELKTKVPVACITMYCDGKKKRHMPFLSECKQTHSNLQGKSAPANEPNDVNMTAADEMDDEDMDIYGESKDDMDIYGDSKDPVEIKADDTDLKDQITEIDEDSTPRHWCFTSNDDGCLIIYSVPDMVERFRVKDFYQGPRIVTDQAKPEFEMTNHKPYIEEIVIQDLGADSELEMPYLICRTKLFDIIIYKIIPVVDFDPKFSDDRLAIRLFRIEHTAITRELINYNDEEGDKLQPMAPPAPKRSFIKKAYLIPFTNVGDSSQLYSGVILNGKKPFWIMLKHSNTSEIPQMQLLEESEGRYSTPALASGSNCIRFHPMMIDGPIHAFAALNNVNVPNGFCYMNQKGLFRLCQLPLQFNYDYDWGICVVPLGRAARKLSYHMDSETYVMATSRACPFEIEKARYMAAVSAGVIDDGDELPDSEKKVSGIAETPAEREPGQYIPSIDLFQLELVSPITWETVDIVKMGATEQILTVEMVELASKENTSGRKMFIALGTGYMRSEDLACRGRLLVYDVNEVVPEIDNPQTNHKLKVFYSNEEKNPVTALCAVNGYLLAAIGMKIIMYAMEESSLNGVAFLDVNMFVVSLSSVKNFISISDVYKSVWFVVFQEDPAKLELLGKDLYPVEVSGAGFMISNSDLAIFVSDELQNLHVLSYEPYAVQSIGGRKLLRRGEMNLGFKIEACVSMRFRPTIKDGEMIASNQVGVIAGTIDGGLAMVTPVSEKLFKRLYCLYSRMVTHLEHHAGLNPRGYRQLKLPYKSIYSVSAVTGPPGPRGVLDGGLVYRYCNLSAGQQRDIAKAFGSRDDRIIDDLLEASLSLSYF
ncbi:CPSF A subunit region-domain-containing protein, partial [Globomyces pollinis-pini]